MRYGIVSGIDQPVSRIVLGISGMRVYDTAAPVLDAFVERGGNCLDSAFVYGQGASEAVVGRWIRDRGCRDRLVLLGKGAHPPECRPESVEPQLHTSLDRLGTDHLDLYMLHRDDPDVPVSEWIDVLEDQVRQGRIRGYGASNWTTARIDEANRYAASRGYLGFTALSNHFSLASMTEPLYPGCVWVDDAGADWLRDRQLPLFPWSSQARGFFSDVDRTLLDPNTWRCWDTDENQARRRRAELVGGRFRSPAINVALAYVLTQPFPTYPLIGPRDTGELEIALGALSIDLTGGLLAWLRSGQPTPAHVTNEGIAHGS